MNNTPNSNSPINNSYILTILGILRSLTVSSVEKAWIICKVIIHTQQDAKPVRISMHSKDVAKLAAELEELLATVPSQASVSFDLQFCSELDFFGYEGDPKGLLGKDAAAELMRMVLDHFCLSQTEMSQTIRHPKAVISCILNGKYHTLSQFFPRPLAKKLVSAFPLTERFRAELKRLAIGW